ncbi:hypothetical protein COU59_02555 [Candidatus Pacearchaeota archaeon CG10_big_fil_rev_8_21_14_0_10_34_12]|nr:MAG: hypothetical protein COU59_02555 [Candidatus Pacearchaeota archaeon CG10_big_fil_rev_8_21_14_0_10_34_12]
MKKKQKQKTNFFLEQYRKSWKFIKDSQNFIYSVIGIFFFFAIIGFFIPVPETLKGQIIEFLNQLLQKTRGLSQGELIRFIFLNNLQSSFLGIAFGFVLGIFPLMAAISNGYVLGFVSTMAVNADGFSSLLGLFPHGIFELPAVFISLGLGLRVGVFIFQKKKIESLKNYLINSFRVFVFVVVPLLAIAAIIEGIFIIMFR